MLDALAEAKWISQSAADELKTAYRFMRGIEHRVQMVNDEQTHVLPQNELAFESLARLSGFASTPDFEEKLRRTFELVQGHYSALFESAGELGTDTGAAQEAARDSGTQPRAQRPRIVLINLSARVWRGHFIAGVDQQWRK
jgi:glutamine synthetase adenylyltransferase